MHRLSVIVVLALSVVALQSCSKERPTLPTGVQTVTGTIEEVPLSLTRRGTHVLKVDGQVICYLESTKVNLRQHAGERATLKGVLEYNTHEEDLPVLVVSELESKSGGTMTRWTFGKTGISFEVPVAWKSRGEGEFVTFTSEGSYDPLLSVFLEDLASPFSVSDPARAFTVGKLKAIWVSENDGSEKIMIDRGTGPDITPSKRVMVVVFHPTEEGNMDDQEQLFRSIKNSFRTGNVSSSSKSSRGAVSSTGKNVPGTGQPCGGVAGVLCPAGLYCEITDTESNTGKCKAW